jgi:probable O-sialoglycoprotein endopeptidase
MPPLRFCTDNGAQIAAIGSELVAAGLPPSDWDFSPDSGMELTTTYVPPRA